MFCGHVEKRVCEIGTSGGEAVPVGETLGDGTVVWRDGLQEEGVGGMFITSTIIERERRLHPRTQRGFPERRPRRKARIFLTRRGGGLSMGDICTDALSDEILGVV